MKRPFIFKNRIGDYYFLWIWRIALVWIVNAEHTNPNRLFEIWKAERGISLIFGTHGIGIAHSFGLS